MAKRTPRTSSGAAPAAKPARNRRAKGPADLPPEPAADARDAATMEPPAIMEVPPSLPAGLEPSGNGATASVSMSSAPSEEDIRLRAYHRFLHRGAGPGGEFEDWIKAEEELRRK